MADDTNHKPPSNMRTDLVSSLLGESLITAKDYLTLPELFRESSFTPDEQEVILFILNHENRCDTCLQSHTNLHEEYSAANEYITALFETQPIFDWRINALLAFMRDIIRTNGHITPENIKQFMDAGFTQKNVMELITAHAMQSIKNYTFHIGTPVE